MTAISSGRASARSLRFFGKWLVLGFIIATLLRLLLLQVYVVTSGSMENELREADRILVWKLDRFVTPKRGDVVVFDGTDSLAGAEVPSVNWWQRWLLAEPLDNQLFVKRVIAIGGDRLKCCSAAGQLLLNGKPLAETYLATAARAATSKLRFDVEVPQGRMFVLGDNRAKSFDSLDLLGRPGGGMIGIDKIVGRVVAIAWPPVRMSRLERSAG